MRIFNILSLPLALTAVLSMGVAAKTESCGRRCLANFVNEVLESMVAHDPTTLPLAKRYKATENGHPTALAFMQSWRTIVSAGEPSLLAIDVKNGSAYFALDINEGNPDLLNILRGRIAVVNRTITEVELFINRARGDHGFSFSSVELPANYAIDMDVPSNATLPSRKELMRLSEGLFSADDTWVTIGDNCQFTEIGWVVVDAGPYSNGSWTEPVGCHRGWTNGPVDENARAGLVVDETLGIVVQSGMIPGIVYPWRNESLSAFIPNDFPVAQIAQEVWIESAQGQNQSSLLYSFAATGETLQVLQYYDDALQAIQINVFLAPPNATSAWLT